MNVLLTLFLLFLVIVLLFTNLKYRDNFQMKDIICDTIQNQKDCNNYGCKYLTKETKLKCADGAKYNKNVGCPIFIKSELEKQLEAIKDCDLMGGTEIQHPDNSSYKICSNPSSKCISNYDKGCFHINNEDICKNKNKCKWNNGVSMQDRTNKYCYPNLTLKKDHACLQHKFKTVCNNDQNCRYYANINKCLNRAHDLCNTYTKDNCNKDDLCHWNEPEQSCNVKKSLSDIANNIKTTLPSNTLNIDFNSNSLDPDKVDTLYMDYIIESTPYVK